MCYARICASALMLQAAPAIVACSKQFPVRLAISIAEHFAARLH